MPRLSNPAETWNRYHFDIPQSQVEQYSQASPVLLDEHALRSHSLARGFSAAAPHFLHVCLVIVIFAGLYMFKNMKTRSQSEIFAIGNDSNQRRRRRPLPPAAVTLMLMLALGDFTIAAADTNVCEQTAEAVFFSDEASALSDYRLALAKAINITDPPRAK